jgi:hypothetical protein
MMMICRKPAETHKGCHKFPFTKKRRREKALPLLLGAFDGAPLLLKLQLLMLLCVSMCVYLSWLFRREFIIYKRIPFFPFVCVWLVFSIRLERGHTHTHTQHSLGLCWLDTFSWPRLNESRYLYRNKLSIHLTRRYVQKNVFECMGTRDARSSFIIASPGFFSSSSKVYTRMHQPAGQRWPILLLPQVYYLCRHASLSHTAYTHRGQGRFLKIIIIISCWMSLTRRTCLFSSSSSSSSPLYWICKTIVCVCVCVFGNRRFVGPALCGGSRRTY